MLADLREVREGWRTGDCDSSGSLSYRCAWQLPTYRLNAKIEVSPTVTLVQESTTASGQDFGFFTLVPSRARRRVR